MTKKLGIIQSRGLGDIVLALPIALHYKEQGYEILWPITDVWVEQMQHYVPWIKWIPLKQDSGAFFYDTPKTLLRNFKCDEIICLYNSLTGHPEFAEEPFFQFTTFDQYKYAKAGVPFLDKWRLNECIKRDPAREQALYDQKVKNPLYAVTHLTSSQHTVPFDASVIPQEWDVIDIDNTGWIFDWLKVIEGAQSIIMTNSVFANMVDLLKIGDDKYFIPLHHLNWSPTFGTQWTWLHNENTSQWHKSVSGQG